jgi:hypothetical protein
MNFMTGQGVRLKKMVSFEEQIQAACDARQIPGVVLLAESADGTLPTFNTLSLQTH